MLAPPCQLCRNKEVGVVHWGLYMYVNILAGPHAPGKIDNAAWPPNEHGAVSSAIIGFGGGDI